jgi:hypothetical protein
LSAHKTLLGASFFNDPASIPANDQEHEARAIEVARLAALYSMQLLFRWQVIMEVQSKMYRANPNGVPSTKNLSRPDADPLSNN